MQRLKTKGWGPWKQSWFSLCSIHFYHDDNCNMCAIGSWTNTWRHFISTMIYVMAPKFWDWWRNKDMILYSKMESKLREKK